MRYEVWVFEMLGIGAKVAGSTAHGPRMAQGVVPKAYPFHHLFLLLCYAHREQRFVQSWSHCLPCSLQFLVKFHAIKHCRRRYRKG